MDRMDAMLLSGVLAVIFLCAGVLYGRSTAVRRAGVNVLAFLALMSFLVHALLSVALQRDLLSENKRLRRELAKAVNDAYPLLNGESGREPAEAFTAVSLPPAAVQDSLEIKILSDGLSVLSPGKIVVWEIEESSTSVYRASLLVDTLRSAGWQVKLKPLVSKVPLTGILMRAQATALTPRLRVFRKALLSLKVPVTYLPDTNIPEDELIVVFGAPEL